MKCQDLPRTRLVTSALRWQQARCRLRPPDGSPIPRHPGKKFEVARMPGPQAGARAAEKFSVG